MLKRLMHAYVSVHIYELFMNIDMNSYNRPHFDLFRGILISQKIDSIVFQCQKKFLSQVI